VTDALLTTLVVLACVSVILQCFLWGMVADLRTRLWNIERELDSIQSLTNGTNNRVADLHKDWHRADRAEGRG
jgi:hypothetical protein